MEENELSEVKQEQAGTTAAATTAVAAVRELLRFPLQDPAWRNKFLIGSGLIFLNFVIPLLPSLAVSGYCLKIMKQSIRGETPLLPEWDDWGDLIMEGLKATALALIYLAPGYLVLIGGIVVTTFGQLLVLPISGLIASSGDPEALFASVLALIGISMGAALLQIVTVAVGLLVLLLGALPLPLAIANYLHEGEFSAGLRLRQIWGFFKVNKSGYLAAWVICIGLLYTLSLSAIFAYMTIVLICLLPFIICPVSFYSNLIGASAFGQYYRESRAMWEKQVVELPEI